eukprot:TRINITY_DN2666_c0_g1_i14.p1 TRINITY_DN2666_c0_g1~~TRINITY_DN2666_c0_g1_i14.p1  ORF type:complete len:146 (-),score=30.12 TRINITY_DN2666_c0_g1_i14:41-478(-)
MKHFSSAYNNNGGFDMYNSGPSYEPQYFNPMEYQRSPMYSGGGMPPMYNMNNMAQPQNMYPFQPGPEAFTPFQGSVNPLFNNNPYGYGFKFPMPMNPLQTRVMSASSFMGGQSQMPQGQPPMFNQPAAMRMNCLLYTSPSPRDQA